VGESPDIEDHPWCEDADVDCIVSRYFGSLVLCVEGGIEEEVAVVGIDGGINEEFGDAEAAG